MKLFKIIKEGGIKDNAYFLLSKNKNGFTFFLNLKNKFFRVSVASIKRK